MAWLLACLNMHHLPSFFGEDPDSPLQILQMAAAVGLGEWAAAYNQVEDGLERLFTLANSPLWRVREVSALGLERLLLLAWDRTILRLRYQCLIANIAEWHALLLVWRDSADALLTGQHGRLLDVLDLLQTGLRFIANLNPETREKPAIPPLLTLFQQTLTAVVRVNPELGSAQLGVWGLWQQADVQQIIQLTLQNLED